MALPSSYQGMRDRMSSGLSNSELQYMKELKDFESDASPSSIAGTMRARGMASTAGLFAPGGLLAPPIIDPSVAATIEEEKRAAEKAKREAEVMKQKAEALVAKQQADLGRQTSQYYDRTVDDRPRPPIMFSMGKAVDAPGGRLPIPYSQEAQDSARVVGNKAYLAPPQPVAYEPPADSQRLPYQKYNYTMNEQGRQAMASMGNQPAPPQISPEAQAAILAQGGSMDSSRGEYMVKPPPVPPPVPPPGIQDLIQQRGGRFDPRTGAYSISGLSGDGMDYDPVASAAVPVPPVMPGAAGGLQPGETVQSSDATGRLIIGVDGLTYFENAQTGQRKQVQPR